MPICSSCKTQKPVDEFGKNPSRPSGHDYDCLLCRRERARRQRAAAKAKNQRPTPPELPPEWRECDTGLFGISNQPLRMGEPGTVSFQEPPPPPTAPHMSPLEAAESAQGAAKAKRDLKTEHGALLEENARLRTMLEAAKGFGAAPSFDFIAPPSTRGSAVACIVASDWHIEEPVEAEKVHGINQYDLDIARARAEKFFANALRVTNMMAKDSDIRTLWIGFLGDFISGHIHEELQETNSLAPGEAAQFATGLLASGIEFLLKNSPYDLVIDCIPGNHGRMTKKVRIQNATETSLETFMYHGIAGRFEKEPRVKFTVARSKMLYRRFFEKFTMRLIHGDDIKFGGGVGGVTIPIRKKLAAWDKATRADLTVMGHFHQLLNGGDFIVNGSLIGYNEFAQAIGASPEEPRQAFFLVHNRHGGQVSVFAPIWLD